MTIESLWTLFADATLALSLALLPVLLIRTGLQIAFGARAAYASWLAVPCALLALAVPGGWVAPQAGRPTAVAAAIDATPVHVPAVLPQSLLLAAWALGACVLLIAFALRHRDQVLGLGLQRDVRADVWRSASADVSPMVLGFWQPRLVLPADFERRFDQEEQILVLAHEREHLRSQDLRINMLALCLLTLVWFNPLAWWAWRCFRLDQELACDARVVQRFPRQRRAYARAMLKAQLDPALRPLACAWSDPHPLHRRIAMLTRPSPSLAVVRTGRIVVALLTLGSGTAIWAQKPAPQQDSIAHIVRADARTPVADASARAVMVPAIELQPIIDAAMKEANAALQSPEVQAAIQVGTDAAVKEAMAVLAQPEVQSAMQAEIAVAMEQVEQELQSPAFKVAIQAEVSAALNEAMAEINSAEVQSQIRAEVAAALREATQAIDAVRAPSHSTPTPDVAPAPAIERTPAPKPEAQPAPPGDRSTSPRT
jgi:beta-lactamase regulating signal transducer with metallopeptidase domain